VSSLPSISSLTEPPLLLPCGRGCPEIGDDPDRWGLPVREGERRMCWCGVEALWPHGRIQKMRGRLEGGGEV